MRTEWHSDSVILSWVAILNFSASASYQAGGSRHQSIVLCADANTYSVDIPSILLLWLHSFYLPRHRCSCLEHSVEQPRDERREEDSEQVVSFDGLKMRAKAAETPFLSLHAREKDTPLKKHYLLRRCTRLYTVLCRYINSDYWCKDRFYICCKWRAIGHVGVYK